MATIDLGKIKQVWRGTYSSSNSYTADDLVAYTDTVGGLQNTSTYIAVAASSNSNQQAPSSGGTVNSSYWNLVAQGVPDRLPSQTGQAGKFLKTDGSAVSFDNVETDWNKFAIFELYDTGANFRCFPIVMGVSGGQNNMQIHWNNIFDHGNIIGSHGSYKFQVNETGPYTMDVQFVNHNPQHYRLPYLYNHADSKAAETYNSTGAKDTNSQFNCIGYHDNESGHLTFGEKYYLETGKDYDFRFACDGSMAGMSTGTAVLLANRSLGGCIMKNVVWRARINKVSIPST